MKPKPRRQSNRPRGNYGDTGEDVNGSRFAPLRPACSGTLRLVQERIAQVGLIRLMFESPFIPSLNAFLERRKVGCIAIRFRLP
jgi:hypothetical protein